MSRYEPISEYTLRKYLDLVTRSVERKITKVLPDRFAIIIDGWIKASTLYVGVFATYASEELGNFHQVLLAFSPLFSETEFGAEQHFDLISWVLNLYEKTMENLVAIIGDNVSVNKALATKCGVPLIGCASHRFNLAVNEYVKPNKELIEKVNLLMNKLKKLKNADKLRAYTNLRPVQKNETRWNSLYEMFKRYSELREYLSKSDFAEDPLLVDTIPSPRENADIVTLSHNLAKFNSIQLALQKEKTRAETRALFASLINEYPVMAKYISQNSAIVHSKDFESAIVKIQDEKYDCMNFSEKQATVFLKAK